MKRFASPLRAERSRAVAATPVSLAARPAPLAFARARHDSAALDEDAEGTADFILSILQASPSVRDSRSYMASFAPRAPGALAAVAPATSSSSSQLTNAPSTLPPKSPLVSSLLNPTIRHPALVKIQGPFTDTQLASICRAMSHLQKLGLVSVIVVDRDDIPPVQSAEPAAAHAHRTMVLRDVERVVHYLGRARAPARPVLASVARLQDDGAVCVDDEGLDHVRRAVDEGEIPILLPVALDDHCRSRRVSADSVLCALAKSMSASAASGAPPTAPVPAAEQSHDAAEQPHDAAAPTTPTPTAAPALAPAQPRADLTPHRLLIINREGGIPSYARSGLPHLSINLSSELAYITRTFQPHWRATHPTALSSLALADACLAHLPRSASALVMSHRSPAALVANLITNKPAHSASLPHALLTQAEGRITRDTPTLIRRGLPVRVLRNLADVDAPALTRLLEHSFGRTLDANAFYARLARDLDFVIVIGDYAGAAIVTTEGVTAGQAICYLDKFAVRPAHQGDGTVDFLWVALRDETYGLGLLDAANPSEGSLAGHGRGRDLVWRSRADNPVNKWYFERSNGFVTSADGKWRMFWCDAQQRVTEIARENGGIMRVVEGSEEGRLAAWAPVIEAIPSAWAR
ncbi:Amino-acid acetyltransferase, mitochondrial [Cryptotrichosporon argae]